MSTKKTVTVAEIEAGVFAFEGIRVILRAPAGKKVANIPYTDGFINRCAKTHNLGTLRKRIAQIVGDGIEVEVIDAKGNAVHGGTKIGNLRDTYAVPA